MLDNKRLNFLYQKFAVSEVMPDDQLSGLTLEELSFIYAMTETAKKDERFSQIHFPIRQQIVYWAAVDAFKSAEALYVAYNKMPMYPYIDPMGSAWIFSDEELAKKLADNLRVHQQVELIVRKIENKMIMPMVAQMHYLGINNIVIDNGSHPMLLKRTDILPDPEWKGENGQPKQDFSNGPLQMAMIQFFQHLQLNGTMHKAMNAEGVSEEEKKNIQQKFVQGQQVIKMMETRMLSLLVDAKFLVPSITMKDGQPLPPGQDVPAGEGVTRKLASVVDANKVAWLPAFTDWSEFIKTYRPNEWGAMALPYEAVIKMAKEAGINKIVFNPRGCAFRVEEQMIDRIEDFRKKKAEFAAKQAEEQAKKAAEAQENQKAEEKKPEPVKAEDDPASTVKGVIYGDLIDAPEMMMGALKRTAKTVKNVKKMWLAQRMEGENRGYLLVVEALSDTDKTIEELKRASAGYLDGKIMEVRQADPSALQLVKDIKPFYKKGLFG